jgi:crotonobetainyl-CoA:carnitine CoA-transferase CaiB-like acyl-CoA transferase
MIIEMEKQKSGRVKVPGMPIRVFGMTGKDPVTRPPLLGEHNQEIYCGKLGYSSEKLNELRTKGVI